MADEEGQVPQPGEEAQPKKKKGKMKLLLLVVMPLVLILGAGAGVWFFGDSLAAKYLGKTPAGEKPEAKKREEVGPILTLEPFIFNLSGNTTRFAKVSLAVGVKDPKVLEEAKKMVPVLRDKALVVLSGKTADVLIDVANRDTIKKELHESLKGLFKGKEDLQSVYITDIILP